MENKGIVKIFIIRDTLRTTGPFTLISGYSEELASPLSNTKIGQVKDRHLHIFQIKSFYKDCPLIIRAAISMHLIEGNYLEIHLHCQSPSWKFNLSLVSKNNKKIQRAEVWTFLFPKLFFYVSICFRSTHSIQTTVKAGAESAARLYCWFTGILKNQSLIFHGQHS